MNAHEVGLRFVLVLVLEFEFIVALCRCQRYSRTSTKRGGEVVDASFGYCEKMQWYHLPPAR